MYHMVHNSLLYVELYRHHLMKDMLVLLFSFILFGMYSIIWSLKSPLDLIVVEKMVLLRTVICSLLRDQLTKVLIIWHQDWVSTCISIM